MKIQNVDGNYATSDGSVKVIVTRRDITITVSKPKQPNVIIIDEEDDTQQPQARQRGQSSAKPSTLRKIGKGMNDLTYALMGGDER